MEQKPGRRKFFKTAGLAAAGAALAEVLAGYEVRADDDDDDRGGIDKNNFIRAVKRARIFDLSHTWDENSPIAGVNPSFNMTFDDKEAATHARTRGAFNDGGQLSFAGEVMRWSGQ